MMRNRVFAVIAYLCFALFLGVVAWRVPRLDLAVIVTVVLALAAFDIWTELRARGRR
ncbi:hypothetical protein [Arvimicrobium flavum]|uniref:hypothetical protein n=1 Tax=Arvimicrobium flavum TaxID=3393320 RepID=UPI00237A404E|nr:hypothetical protein [Mesorhizobium shangrilense]